MPKLAALLAEGLTAFAAWLAMFMTKRIALGVAFGAFLIAGWVGIQVSFYAAWLALGFVLPTFMEQGLSIVLYLLPDNTGSCLATIVTARAGLWLWRQQIAWTTLQVQNLQT